MSFNIILNSDNVSNNTNSQYKYNFISGNFKVLDNAEICISLMQIPYSWFNITTNYNNTKFDFIDWLGVTRNITLPDGFYTISDINNYLETYSINNGLYLINANGKNVFYFSIFTNQQYYRNQFLFYNVPTSLPTGWTQPAGWIGYPATTLCPRVVILSNNFRDYLGFNAGTYGGGAVPLSIMGQNTPIGSYVNSLLIRCSLVSNAIGFPPDIVDSFSVEGAFGANINYTPTFEKWVKMKSGTYNNLIIEITDQNNNPIVANDNNVTISLLLKNK